MALHNYIYTKHPNDVLLDNKIARKHDPRPTAIKGTDIEPGTKLTHNDNSNITLVVDDHSHTHTTAYNELGMGMDMQSHVEAKDMHHLEDDYDEEESSDSDHIRRRIQSMGATANTHDHHHHDHHHIHTHTHTNTHAHAEHSVVPPIVTLSPAPHKPSSASLLKPSTSQQKWVYIHGKKRKLKSRFAKSNTPEN
jgi:hypothetical protein